LIIAQCTEQSIYFHCSKENGTARYFIKECISQSKNLIKALEDLCDEIDERISFGQEEKN
jgi:hypothetical protein